MPMHLYTSFRKSSVKTLGCSLIGPFLSYQGHTTPKLIVQLRLLFSMSSIYVSLYYVHVSKEVKSNMKALGSSQGLKWAFFQHLSVRTLLIGHFKLLTIFCKSKHKSTKLKINLRREVNGHFWQ